VKASDRIYLQRAYELAARGIGSTAPNPPVGAVVVRDGRILGEGYHRAAGREHAEIDALQGVDARGATLYVSLEPCNHVGRTPPCTQRLLDAGIARVVIGTLDPTSSGGGAELLRERGIDVSVTDDARARSLIEMFVHWIASDRPFVTLKMAMSIDGAIAARPGRQEWLTGAPARAFVRSLRIAHDAVMVGAGTVRIDDPQLTVRPPHQRLRPYVRVVACETDLVPASSRIFSDAPEDRRTIVLAPAGLRGRLGALNDVAEVLAIGDADTARLDLGQGMRALRRAGVYSVLCEGGPTLAARLIAGRLVDRIVWIIAPLFLQGAAAVPVLAGAELGELPHQVRVDRVEQLGDDVMISGRLRID
jgi:diaminohydroxyphosphoribosylaminopyrimidine deaminase/5-amino-6-(5-phosphoribosylamino)uracil reductase